MDAAKFLKEKDRMTRHCDINCNKCPMSYLNNGFNKECTLLTNEQEVSIVEKWSNAHPKTARYIDAEVLKNEDFQDFSNTDVMYAIDHCPAADVQEVKHASWLYNRNNDYEAGIHTAECSKCCITQSVEFYRRKPIFEYCPRCGAKMDGEQK